MISKARRSIEIQIIQTAFAEFLLINIVKQIAVWSSTYSDVIKVPIFFMIYLKKDMYGDVDYINSGTKRQGIIFLTQEVGVG